MPDDTQGAERGKARPAAPGTAEERAIAGDGASARPKDALGAQPSVSATDRGAAPPGPAIVVLSPAPEDATAVERAAALAARLGVPLASSIPDGGVALCIDSRRLELRTQEDRPGRGVRSDPGWVIESLRRGGNALRGDPLARALGRGPKRIVDATAGLGGDAFHLAALGHTVIAIERNPIVHALLEDGLAAVGREAHGAALGERIELRCGDASALLGELREPPQVVLIDPMFPSGRAARRGSALPPKSMQRLRLVVGDDDDAPALLLAARRAATERVVAKRGDALPPIRSAAGSGNSEGAGRTGDTGPAWSIAGTTVRYDVYRPEA
ncbi:MAG TPA: class I SAM-dependent methyltransferase [Phycisphaerales bacterium]|nr:class I SAM-dependent methyltransferase [Phycisphaerales bacterium]HMP37856.1 class I SAM-dependent methyltransferase [Phycisphaerales bacterium]